MSDNPFAEPDDSDRTILRGPAARPVQAQAPMPAAAPAVPPGPRMAPPPSQPAQRLAGEADALPKVGISPLVAAAAPLLDLLTRLNGQVHVADPGELRERCVRGLRQFEVDAREAEVHPDQLRAGHYALCAALDDVALSQPWAPNSIWPSRSLVSTFHQETKSGERFFDLLTGMQKDPGRYLQALEISYLCLSLGLQGRYRLAPRGAAELDRIREGLYQLLTQLCGGWERELSPHWRGVDAPHRVARRGIPAWVAVPLMLAILGFGYAGLSQALNNGADELFARLLALPPATPPEIERVAPPVPPAPPPPPPPQAAPPRPTLAQRLREFLAPEIQQGLVTVTSDPNRTMVRIRNRGMFDSGKADVQARFIPLLTRIGEALRDEPGRVQVIGHSDNQPIRTARFPSNFALSAARADAARQIIFGATGGPAARFTSEGRGESEPLTSNATPDGREENRRIEVVVFNGGQN